MTKAMEMRTEVIKWNDGTFRVSCSGCGHVVDSAPSRERAEERAGAHRASCRWHGDTEVVR